ncbi:MAG TPA: biotin--[acetyl-CoA-carboxylase] ligase [Woeseiaceae bacterium]|nr:biotin--[acetyl-CoA-carboxylase] ligase [Woeseiaceae bacterium]
MTTLDEAAIRGFLDAANVTGIEDLAVFREIGSTNTYLRDGPPPARGSFRAALADHQTAGRGRGGNRWVSAPGRSLCLSLAHTFATPPAGLPAFTLALGVSAVEVLAGFDAAGVGLKWPNDLLVADAKLGGILTETQHRPDGTAVVVAGLGLNVRLPLRLDDAPGPAFALRPVDLASLVDAPPSRERLAAAMLAGWCRAFAEFAAGGFAPFVERFNALDWLRGRSVTMAAGERRVAGVAAGVDASGALLIETGAGTVPVSTGSVVAVKSISGESISGESMT